MNDPYLIIKLLAAKLIWIAPVGNTGVEGFMVCRRVINNPDGKNTRVDYLRKDMTWKKPFRQDEHLFPNIDTALEAAKGALERILASNWRGRP